MPSRRTFLRHALSVAALGATAAACGSPGSGSSASTSAAPRAPTSGPGRAAGATAITEVFGDGQKLTAVAVQYPQAVKTAALTTAAFTVADRTVTRVYANTAPVPVTQGVDGPYVIVELSTTDATAALYGMPDPSAAPGGSAKPAAGGPPAAGQASTPPRIDEASATVTQAQAVTAVDGTSFAASTTAAATSAVRNLVVDDFRQLTWNDSETGQTLNYNLFVPPNYDKAKSYPLVLFMHDASVVSGPTTATLLQGLGAVCWASPADQAKRECFVVAPQYPVVVIDDDYQPTNLFDATVNLVNELPRQYSIDTSRLYATGQSMGAMMTLGMNVRHPDLFAASFVVAGQWPAAQAAPLAGKKLWVAVSEGDDKAYPGENAIMDVVTGQGTRVTRATWDGRATSEQFAADVRQMTAGGTPVNYASFVKGSLLPAGTTTGMEHTLTWPVAYTIDGIRDWIFEQRG